MSKENETALTDQEASDVFDQMAETFDKQIGATGKATSFRDVIEEDDADSKIKSDLDDGETVAANAQQQTQSEDEFNFESLPASAQKKIQELEQYRKSNEGRVGALQRKIDEQSHYLEQLKQQGKGDSAEAKAAEDNLSESEDSLSGLYEDFPEMRVLSDELKSVKTQLKKQNDFVQENLVAPAAVRAAKEAEDREYSALQQMHSDLNEVASNPNFWSWVDSQHESISALANSNNARDVDAILTLYKKSNPSPATPSPANKPTRNIDDMVVLPSSGNSRSISATGDEDELFNHYADLADKGKL